MTEQAKQARREYAREWREKNREHIRAYHKLWRSKNNDKVKAAVERHWEKKALAKGDEE